MEAAQQPGHPVQRMRLVFSKEAAVRYISHLDLARALERALNRAGLPVAYSQGFNRRPRLSMGAALPLGYTSEAERADVWLVEPVEPEHFRARLAASLPPGMAINAVAEVPLSSPSLQQEMVESTYLVRFLDAVDEADLRRRAAALLAAPKLSAQRRRAKDSQPKTFDLRPLILDMGVISGEGDGPQLVLRLVQTATQTGRPEDVLAALGVDPLDALVHRTGLRVQESSG